jgi:hypothetical protein
VGALSVMLFGIFASFTLQRSGSLWFAIGLHAATDYAETFIYSVPDSEMLASAHLAEPSVRRGAWLTLLACWPHSSWLRSSFPKEASSGGRMNTLARDFGYAVRMLAKSPGFTLAAILSLAIGIGANTSIFSLVNALLLRPLQYQDANRLVILWNRSPGLNITEDWFSTAQYFDIKTGHHGFEQVAIAIGGNRNLTSQGNRSG